MKEENVVLSSPLAGGARRTGKSEGYIKENTYLNPLIGFECYRTQNHFPRQGGSQTAGGFTLIELLVVVLIIGILAAVALPQYQKVVEKSRAAEAITLLNGVYQAYQHYYLANGQAPTQLNELSVEIPWTGNIKWQGVGSNLAHGSNENWDLALYDNSEHSLTGVCVGRISGNYSGGGFCKFITNAHNLENDRLYCVERSVRGFILEGPIGRYCVKLFKGNFKVSNNMRIYEMP